MQVTFNAFAYRHDYHDMAEIESGKEMPIIFDFDDTTSSKIGTAVVTVTLFPKAEIYTKELAMWNKKLQEVRADNHVRENAILDRISKLTAIGHEVKE
jgi:hypothetical protein